MLRVTVRQPEGLGLSRAVTRMDGHGFPALPLPQANPAVIRTGQAYDGVTTLRLPRQHWGEDPLPGPECFGTLIYWDHDRRLVN